MSTVCSTIPELVLHPKTTRRSIDECICVYFSICAMFDKFGSRIDALYWDDKMSVSKSSVDIKIMYKVTEHEHKV
jgi:hypothetical protein